MEREPWSVEMVRSGGATGFIRPDPMKEAELSPAEAQEVTPLVEQVEAAPSARRTRSGSSRDIVYEFTVRRGERSRVIVLAEPELPPAAKELSSRIIQHARKRPPGT